MGIFGYTGGHGASISPAAMSRSCKVSTGSRDCRSADMPVQGSPCSATRDGTVAMVSSRGLIDGSSSQPNGVVSHPTDRPQGTAQSVAMGLRQVKVT